MTKTSPRFPESIGLNITREQKQAWTEAAQGRPLAEWIRGTLDHALTGAGADEMLAHDTAPVPPVPVSARPGPSDTPSSEMAGVLQPGNRRKGPAEVDVTAAAGLGADAPAALALGLNPSCLNANTHWRIPQGLACPVCQGVAA